MVMLPWNHLVGQVASRDPKLVPHICLTLNNSLQGHKQMQVRDMASPKAPVVKVSSAFQGFPHGYPLGPHKAYKIDERPKIEIGNHQSPTGENRQQPL